MSTAPNRSSTPELLPGELLGDRFRVDSVLGIGGMATVYKATDESLGRTVALKVFRSDLADADDVRRQRDEIQLIASLNAPGLVTLFDAVAEGAEGKHGRAFLVLEFVDGVDLRTRLLDGGLSAALVARIGADVAGALAYIHGRGVVHRDVKPANILLPHDTPGHAGPSARLADFGIARLLDDARLTAVGTIIGTASYLSPEQARGATVAAESDVYSLGLVLLESLTGERAFPGPALESMSARLARDPEIPEALGAEWVSALGAMTSRRPEDRPSAAAVAEHLEALARPLDARAPDAHTLGTAGGRGDSGDSTVPIAATERLEPTRVLHEAPTATRPLPAAPGGGDTTTVLPARGPAAPGRPGPERRRTNRRRAITLAVIGGTAALLMIVLALSLSRPTGAPAASTPPPASTPASTPIPTRVAYPTVGGTLGEHLGQLQRSVAP